MLIRMLEDPLAIGLRPHSLPVVGPAAVHAFQAKVAPRCYVQVLPFDDMEWVQHSQIHKQGGLLQVPCSHRQRWLLSSYVQVLPCDDLE